MIHVLCGVHASLRGLRVKIYYHGLFSEQRGSQRSRTHSEKTHLRVAQLDAGVAGALAAKIHLILPVFVSANSGLNHERTRVRP